MLVAWCHEHSLGYRIVDDGHRLVVDCVNRLDRARSRAENDGEVAGLLPVLHAHLTEQFEHEETLMRLTGSAHLAEHAAEHARMLEVLATIRDAFTRGTSVSGLLMLNLVCFLVSHLRGTDFAQFAGEAMQDAA